MAKNPEAKYVQRVERLLDRSYHTQGVTNAFSNGTPDRYYEGSKNRVLWAEYKYDEKIPANWDGEKRITALQRRWLLRAYNNQINVCVIAGFEWNKGVIMTYPDDWCSIQTREEITSRLITLEQIATYIRHQLS